MKEAWFSLVPGPVVVAAGLPPYTEAEERETKRGNPSACPKSISSTIDRIWVIPRIVLLQVRKQRAGISSSIPDRGR
jgi:hypothetical protein